MDSLMLDKLREFITIRELVRVKKERGDPKPWTSDYIINSYRFCNVNREHDKVTVWINDNIRVPHADSQSLWFNLVLARFFNLPECLEDLGYFEEFDEEVYLDVLNKRRANGDKLYNGAYMIRGGTGTDAAKSKHEYLLDRTFTPLWTFRSQVSELETCEDWSSWFSGFFGMGDFMRNQVITDMKYTRYLENAADRNTFCLAGPGTTRGLNRLYDRDLNASPKAKQLSEELLEVREVLQDHPLSGYFEDLNNLSNCFCEFDKYMRTFLLEGRPKQLYKGK